jgi:hypothetical protein
MMKGLFFEITKYDLAKKHRHLFIPANKTQPLS